MTHGRKKSKWEQRNVVAWDGEGANTEDYRHIYNLIANSNGVSLFTKSNKGLSTKQCLDFMLDNTTLSAINVIYGGSYDVNMILKDLTEKHIRQLWETNTVYWRGYKISYTPRKRFSVYRYKQTSTGRIAVEKRGFVLWDVLGYFQCSFVKACAKWLVDVPMLGQIQQMKNERSVFNVDRLDEIREYNRMECELLVLLVQALFRAMDTAGIVLTRYDGAGSIAAALLRTYNVHEHMGDIPGIVYSHAQVAYSGGRIEAPMIGNEEPNETLLNQRIGRADINSAYPAAARTLPSYKGATWSVDEKWDGTDHSLVRVSWDYRTEAPFYPLFYREKDGTILYPRRGQGVFFGPEIRNLFTFYDEGKDFSVDYAINATLATEEKPFGFIDEIYAIRLGFKQANDMAHEAIKLGMNSVYGKLAQQEGYSVTLDRDGRGHARYPAYHHLLWAGQITSRTRATLYKAAMECGPERIIAFATDAIIVRGETKLDNDSSLGGWSVDCFQGATVVQAGVYWLLNDEGYWQSKYRGFDPGSLERDKVLDTWNRYHWLKGKGDESAGKYAATLTRFVGMGSALARSDFRDYWRTWLTDERMLDTIPQGKRQPKPGHMQYYRRLEPTLPTVNRTPDVVSEPYPIIWVQGFRELRPTIGGVDIRIVENEWEDTYE